MRNNPAALRPKLSSGTQVIKKKASKKAAVADDNNNQAVLTSSSPVPNTLISLSKDSASLNVTGDGIGSTCYIENDFVIFHVSLDFLMTSHLYPDPHAPSLDNDGIITLHLEFATSSLQKSLPENPVPSLHVVSVSNTLHIAKSKIVGNRWSFNVDGNQSNISGDVAVTGVDCLNGLLGSKITAKLKGQFRKLGGNNSSVKRLSLSADFPGLG